MAVTGLNDRVSWGLYISNLVFFIGISYGGTLMSAVLRLTNTDWRTPITRLAESITVGALFLGALFPILDLGRPDRMLNLIIYGRIQSAVLWDFLAIGTYFTGAIVYLYLTLVPDVAILKDINALGRVRLWLYRRLARHWEGTPQQVEVLERGILIMAAVLIPVAISAHSVLAWLFGMTLRVGWHSTIFGPFFVVGAVFSGIAAIVIAMAVFRRMCGLEEYFTLRHFQRLATLLFVMDIALLYFTLSEYLTVAYGAESQDVLWLRALMQGPYALLFWTMIIGGFILPAALLILPPTRTIPGIVTASVLIVVAMWIERVLIVVPTMATPQLPFSWATYQPTWIEWSITAAAFAALALFLALFSKVFPIVSIWETRERAKPEAPAEVPLEREVGA
ncbi:MAG: NrfD/PsrC family molybdoenzyme membrane anchor subunit [Thermoplasmata archaeon]